ncbi:MAG: Transcriptional regulator [Candidatus Carbobacillus altaicus]|uniref:Transcriptional regulator n=1 Tax=Candidatus Carbonibacillus altaicus TaxID=2163959 RepID=A0A2R6Y212_9BACL|nr:MAG: Transcriptional regulator [Candidatus Carbobacillus altaicus]
MGIKRPKALFRPSSLERLGGYRNFTLTLVIAPAGYGKSELLNVYFADKNVQVIDPTSWSDRDWHRALSERFAQATLRPLVVIFDNLDRNAKRFERFEQILAHIQELPPGLPVVATLRESPRHPVVATLVRQGRVLELYEHHLALSEEEVRTFLLEEEWLSIADRDDDKIVSAIMHLTEGWPALVHIAVRYLLRGGTLSSIQSYSDDVLRPMFEYLDAEVLQPFPSLIRGALRDVALLPAIDRENLDMLFPGYAAAVYDELERRRLLWPTTEGKRRLHPVLRRMLLSETPERTRRKVHTELATRCRARGLVAESLEHWLEAEAWSPLANMLSEDGSNLILLGHTRRVFEAIHALPEGIRRQYPRLSLVEGDYYRLSAEYSAAMRCYERAEHDCAAQGDEEGVLKAVEGAVLVYLDTVQPRQADQLLRTKLRAARRKETSVNRRILHFIAENAINIGRPRRAEKIFRMLKRLDMPIDATIYSRYCLRTGRLQEAYRLLIREEREAEEHGLKPEVTLRKYGFRDTPLVLAFVTALLGEAETSKNKAESGLLSAQASNAPFAQAVAWSRLGHAALISGELKTAESNYLKSLALFEEIGVSRGSAEALMGLTYLYARLGKFDLAMSYGERGVALAQAVSDGWIAALIELGIGMTAYYRQDWRYASMLFERVYALAVKLRDQYLETFSALWCALAFHAQEEEASLRTWLIRCLEGVKNGEYAFLFLRQTFYSPRDALAPVPLLIRARDVLDGETAQTARLLLERLGLAHLQTHPGYTLHIEALGIFRVMLGDTPLQERDWQRSNAKRLFQYFLSYLDRDISKERICADLWPDAEEDVVEQQFKVALNALNNALEPRRKARAPSAYIARQGSRYRLRRTMGVIIDSIQFEHAYRIGLEATDEHAAMTALEEGFRYYRGDFLPDNLYDPWVERERERLKMLYFKGSERLAELYVRHGRIDDAITVAETMIAQDPSWESAYRILMIAYYHKQNKAAALRYYETLVNVLDAELSASPTTETEAVVEAIRRDALSSSNQVSQRVTGM